MPGRRAAPSWGSLFAPVRVREYFPETMLWQPNLITDNQGMAELPLQFADSITTWRLSASASSRGANVRPGAVYPGVMSQVLEGTEDMLLTVRTAVLLPDALPRPESWLPLLPPGEKLLRGAVLCRAGKHAEAVKELAEEKTPLACLFRALAEHGRGNREAARQALAEAVKQLPPQKLDLIEHTPLPWADQVEIATLRGRTQAAARRAEPTRPARKTRTSPSPFSFTRDADASDALHGRRRLQETHFSLRPEHLRLLKCFTKSDCVSSGVPRVGGCEMKRVARC